MDDFIALTQRRFDNSVLCKETTDVKGLRVFDHPGGKALFQRWEDGIAVEDSFDALCGKIEERFRKYHSGPTNTTVEMEDYDDATTMVYPIMTPSDCTQASTRFGPQIPRRTPRIGWSARMS